MKYEIIFDKAKLRNKKEGRAAPLISTRFGRVHPM